MQWTDPRELAERLIVTAKVPSAEKPAAKPHPTLTARMHEHPEITRVSVNIGESPLGWLRARGLVDLRQYEAAERLRRDYERASLGPSITMNWNATRSGTGRRGAPEGLDPTAAQNAAKQRFDAVMAEVGAGLADILWRVVCAGEGLPVAEKALGWPSRAGRLVLTLALDRLANAYRL